MGGAKKVGFAARWRDRGSKVEKEESVWTTVGRTCPEAKVELFEARAAGVREPYDPRSALHSEYAPPNPLAGNRYGVLGKRTPRSQAGGIPRGILLANLVLLSSSKARGMGVVHTAGPYLRGDCNGGGLCSPP